jgi:hypothetical protein
LLEQLRFADAVLVKAELSANDIAETMMAPENQPMLKNNIHLANETQRLELAQKTVEVWQSYSA